MKIEKISDNQIRCTLNHHDLVEHNINIGELAYGSEKAKELFREMMAQAFEEVGFEVNDIPLMIEAIPVSREQLILLITKVENPNEMSDRFKNLNIGNMMGNLAGAFGDKTSPEDLQEFLDDLDDADDYTDLDSLDDLDDDALNSNESESSDSETKDEADNNQDNTTNDRKTNIVSEDKITNLSAIFRFDSLDNVLHGIQIIGSTYNSTNSLYKDPATERYYLFINQDSLEKDEFKRICGCLSEYGKRINSDYASLAHLTEHFDLLVADKAVQVLSTL